MEEIEELLEEGFSKVYQALFHIWHTHDLLDDTDRHDVVMEIKRLRTVFEKILEHGYYDLEYD